MKIRSYQLLVNDDTRIIFDDEFIDKQNILISAVENIEARKIIYLLFIIKYLQIQGQKEQKIIVIFITKMEVYS